ncbi:NAD(P)H-dependent oxidoreductase [Patulibacter sp.]|uniref:NAD(P)H-dependent oxidoreductase n=1 Tax=Patulibacter sp. TaxID=1912859 RepID=UPI00271C9068|nr:NAD(P)H-dependent oxidoreductase [Patulibacter sp.]MDO9410904.1 NAD(P)H-dependent oxidoreductase [Patulibacter sp.]
MSTLIVTAHADTDSLTHRAAGALRDLVGPGRTRMAHLAQEGFDPRFTTEDLAAYRGRGSTDHGIRAQQRRVDGASDLVLVFPVYWWSMPALLKGWIDRVFVAGWAFGLVDDRIAPRLTDLTAHLLPVSGTSAESFARHGYADAFRTQVEVGILDFCGIRRGRTSFLHDAESTDAAAVAQGLETAVTAIAAAIGE